MSIADTLIMELEQEAKATRALLARVPDDKLTWKPHAKSMSLGELANHVATTPGAARLALCESFDASNITGPPQPQSTAAIMAAFDESLAQAKNVLAGMDDAAMMKSWSFTKGGHPIMTIPRIGLFRTIMLNHLYHHRGQLSVYLRLLDVPLPSIYGPSADENPFASL
jgi:uncharacterized damage-inducible protein DinB